MTEKLSNQLNVTLAQLTQKIACAYFTHLAIIFVSIFCIKICILRKNTAYIGHRLYTNRFIFPIPVLYRYILYTFKATVYLPGHLYRILKSKQSKPPFVDLSHTSPVSSSQVTWRLAEKLVQDISSSAVTHSISRAASTGPHGSG